MYRISIYIEDVLDKIWEIKLGINWARAKEASWFKRGKKEKKKTKCVFGAIWRSTRLVKVMKEYRIKKKYFWRYFCVKLSLTYYVPILSYFWWMMRLKTQKGKLSLDRSWISSRAIGTYQSNFSCDSSSLTTWCLLIDCRVEESLHV